MFGRTCIYTFVINRWCRRVTDVGYHVPMVMMIVTVIL